MRAFLFNFALGYIATILLTSGMGHLLRPGRFRQLIREHAIMPPGLAGTIALGVAGAEFLGGATALFAFQTAGPGVRAAVLLGAAVAGTAFWLYLRRLLRQPSGTTSCGCSPLSAHLTKASLVPAVGLVFVAAGGLASLGGATSGDALPVVLPRLWGATLAALTILYPASVVPLPPRRET
jgi:hypothetical protein